MIENLLQFTYQMKKRHYLLFACLFMCLNSFGGINDAGQINLEHRHQHGDHLEHYVPADMPEVYYDSASQEIIIEADGFASYYNVEIFQTGYTIPVISTQVDGYGDTIDVSSLSDGDYTIVITSSYNNVFEGDFSID